MHGERAFSIHSFEILTALQKMVVINYPNNPIAWGDNLFRGDTIEKISESLSC
jgi:hypothetical protein